MVGIRLKNVERYRDRHGKTRFYYRVGKGKRIALKGDPGTFEFELSYKVASKSYEQISQPDSQSFDTLINMFYHSQKFLKLKPTTQRVTRNILDNFAKDHGHRLVTDMKRQDVDKLISLKASTPGAANNLLQKLKLLCKFAIKIDWITYNPTVEFGLFKLGEHHTWTEAELEQFETFWPIGSRERTAFALHLYTAQRRGDVCKMQWTDIVGNRVRVQQEKTGTILLVPLHENLLGILAAWREALCNAGRQCVEGPIIARVNGQQFSPNGYGEFMGEAIDKAGLNKRCVLHGLRKAAARRLAEAGSSVHQIASVTGHRTLKEVERYTRAADQEKLAASAISGLGLVKIT